MTNKSRYATLAMGTSQDSRWPGGSDVSCDPPAFREHGSPREEHMNKDFSKSYPKAGKSTQKASDVAKGESVSWSKLTGGAKKC